MYKNLCLHGLVPNHFTFSGLFGNNDYFGSDASLVTQLHCQMVKLGLDCVAFCGNVLLTVYFKLNLLQESVKVFETIDDKDVTSWNTMIAGFCHPEDQSKAISVFRKMAMDSNVTPDDYTFAAVLTAAAGRASIRHGKEIHGRLLRTKLGWDVPAGNALINMYAKTGSITSSYAVFMQMKARNIVSWNSIIAAFAQNGLARQAIALLEEMLRAGFEPNLVTFLELLTACNYSGLANEGQALFNSMSSVHGIAPEVEHLSCLVDLLGRAGRVAEAAEYARTYSLGNDVVVLGSLLSAIRLHGGGTILGDEIGKKLLELHPGTTSPYSLLSNLFALDAKWDGVERVRKMQQSSGLTKEVGRSSVET